MPGTRLNYLADIGQARAHALVQDKYIKNCQVASDIGCWLFQGSTNNDGYGQVSAPQLPNSKA